MLWKLFVGIVASFFIVVPIVHAQEFFPKDLKYGAKGEAVSEMQEFLTDEKLYTGPISGSFYSLTRIAVRKFQKREKIKQTGKWDKKTRERANQILTARLEKEGEEIDDEGEQVEEEVPLWPWLQPRRPSVVPRVTSTSTVPVAKQPVGQPSRIPAFLRPFVQPIVDLLTPTSPVTTPSIVPIIISNPSTSTPKTSTSSPVSTQPVASVSSTPFASSTPPAPTIVTCVDTDGGYNLFKKGFTSEGPYDLTPEPDRCAMLPVGSGVYNSVSEGYCENGVFRSKTEACPSGYVCSEGACIASSPVATTQPALDILNFSAVYPSPTSATLSWSSGRAADASVDCSATNASLQAIGSNSTLSVNHSITINNLASGTGYRCMITSSAGVPSVSRFYNIFTPSAPGVPAVPTVITGAVSAMSTSYNVSSATLNGSANPNGKPTTGWFYYSQYGAMDGICGPTWIKTAIRAPASGSIDLGSGMNTVSYSQKVDGLAPNDPHTFCAFASNGSYTSWGAFVSFTTPIATQAPPGSLPPTVVTHDPVISTVSSINIKASINTSGLSTTAWFRYSTVDPGTCNDSFGTVYPTGSGGGKGNNIIGSGAVGYNGYLNNLTPGGTYYFCAIAQNLAGTTYGNVVSFVAAPPASTDVPTVITRAPDNRYFTAGSEKIPSVRLLGSVPQPNGPSISGWFRYSDTNPGTCNDTFGIRSPSTGGQNIAIPMPTPWEWGYSLNYLPTATTYYYCAIASNSAGTGYGDIVSFPTISTATTTASVATNSFALFFERLNNILYTVITFPARALGF